MPGSKSLCSYCYQIKAEENVCTPAMLLLYTKNVIQKMPKYYDTSYQDQY
jgi:hypothetical protein